MTKTKERAWRNSDQPIVKRKTLTFTKIPRIPKIPKIPSFQIRFPTGDAASKYKMYTKSRNLFMERGFTFSESGRLELPHTVSRVIKAHQWEAFCQNPSPASVPLVREFYANYDPKKPNLVRVRGKLVDASASAINSLYFLTDHQSSFFEAGSKSKVSPPAMRDIVEELTGKRVTCKKAENMYISWGDLKAGQDIWVTFIKSNLLPTPHDTAISKDFAILLYCIMVGKPINVGKVIAKQIGKCASLKSGDLWFPSLITRLCEEHNVLPSSCEPVQQPYPPLLLEEHVESESVQHANPSNQTTSLSDHDSSSPVTSTSHHPWDAKYSMDKFGHDPNLRIPAEAIVNAPSLFDSSCQSPLLTPQATSSQPLPPTVLSAPSAESSSPPQYNSNEVTVPPVTPSALAAEPSSPPQADLDELPIGLNTAKMKERAWINTENQKKKQKTTTQGSISAGNPQPLKTIYPIQFRFPTADALEKYEVYTRSPNLFMGGDLDTENHIVGSDDGELNLNDTQNIAEELGTPHVEHCVEGLYNKYDGWVLSSGRPKKLTTKEENAPPHFDSYQQPPPPTAQATTSQPLPPVAPLAPPAKLSCLPQTDSDKLPAYFQIHVPGLPILADAAENALPHFDSSQQPPPTAQAKSSQSLPPVAPSVLPAEPLSPPQTDSVELQVSSPQSGTICVQGYNVKRSVAPILEAIFKKHGDIAAECQFKTASVRSSFLEVVCEVVTRIEADDVIEKMEEVESQVSDAEAANINVAWLRAHLEAVHKRKGAMKLMETKVNTILVESAARMDLRERCEELMTAQERFEKAERCVRVLHLVRKNIENTISATKAETDLWVKRRLL